MAKMQTSKMENQMEEKVENEMETRVILRLCRNKKWNAKENGNY